MPRFTAVERAATLLRDPLCVARMRAESLPADVSALLRILAGEAEAEAQAAEALGKPKETVREAAEFYVTQILLHSTSDSYRILGARPDASREELRTNLALLMRWLHPDIAGPQHRGYTERVIKAWNDLKAPDTRHALDENLARMRDKKRRSRHDRPRRVDLRPPTQQARPKGKAKPPETNRKKVVFAVVAVVVVVAAGAAYFPGEPFETASQLFSVLLQSSEPATEAAEDKGTGGSKEVVGSPAIAPPKRKALN